MPKIIIRGEMSNNYQAWSLINQGLADELERRGFIVERENCILEDWIYSGIIVKQRRIPGLSCEIFYNNKKIIFLDAGYSTVYPKRFAEYVANKYDLIWVPAQISNIALVNAGVSPEMIKVIPIGFDLDIFNPDGCQKVFPTRKRFKFLSLAGAGLFRKGADVLIKAYTSEFTAKDDVSLIIRQNRYRKLRLKPKKGWPEIIYDYEPAPLEGYIDRNIIASYYRGANCFVHPHRVEGFAMSVMESLLCGLWVITTGWGGVVDYCNEQNADLIEYRLRRDLIPPSIYRYKLNELPKIAEPDINCLRRLMREKYEHGTRKPIIDRARYGWSRVVDELLAWWDQ